MCGCMVQWFVQSISSRNIAGSIPAEYGFTRLSYLSLSLGGCQQPKMCMSEYAWWTKKKKKKKKTNCRWLKTATGSCVVQDQALQQWWSIRSALQPDRWCNSGMSTMLAHSRLIVAYGDGRPKSKEPGGRRGRQPPPPRKFDQGGWDILLYCSTM